VARIAYDILAQEDQSSLNSANDLLTYLKSSEPNITSAEGDYPFVETAIFADSVKGQGGAW
jgi:hypothetical protein